MLAMSQLVQRASARQLLAVINVSIDQQNADGLEKAFEEELMENMEGSLQGEPAFHP